MPVCSYVVLPAQGATTRLAEHLAAVPGCQVARAERHDALLLVTDTSSPEEERHLGETLGACTDIAAMMLAFGQVESGATS